MLKHIFNSIDFYFFKLKIQFEELKSYSYFTDDYLELILSLEKYFEELHNEFLETRKAFRERIIIEEKKVISYFNEKDYESVKFFLDCFKSISYLIYNIKNARSIQYHQANFILIEKFLLKNYRFIILPTFHNNYGYANTPRLFSEQKKIYKKEIDYYDLFLIPYFNQEDIFINTSLAHEIGHYIEEKYGLWNEIRNNSIIASYIEKKIDQHLKKDLKEEYIDTLLKIRHRGLAKEEWQKKLVMVKEIFSDIIGLKLFGLSYFFAYVEAMFLSNPRSVGDEKHPPTWIRLQYMLYEIKNNIEGGIRDLNYKKKNGKRNKTDYNNIGLKLIQLIDFIKNTYANKQEISEFSKKVYVKKKDIMRLVFSIHLHKLIELQIDKLITEGKIEVYSYEQHNEEIIYLMTLLDEYITPNELIIDEENHITNPADIITILNAGWFYYLCKLKKHYKIFDIKENEYEEKSKALQRLNRLILKAIELSNIHEYAKKKLREKKNDKK